MQVYDSSGKIVEEPQVISNLLDIVNNFVPDESSVPIGFLTTEIREVWASARQILVQGISISIKIYLELNSIFPFF